MPMYDYRCERCAVQFEVRQSFSDDTLTLCPTQGGPSACVSPGEGALKKVFSGVSVSFKGDGFYKNDHGSNANGRKLEREAASSKDSTAKSSAESSAESPKDSAGSSSSTDKDSGSSRATADTGASSSASSAP